MKIAINTCYGVFGLSREAYEFLGMEWDGYGYASGTEFDTHCFENRINPKLIECIEMLGEKANGNYASLKSSAYAQFLSPVSLSMSSQFKPF